MTNEARSYGQQGVLLWQTRHALMANEARSYGQQGVPCFETKRTQHCSVPIQIAQGNEYQQLLRYAT